MDDAGAEVLQWAAPAAITLVVAALVVIAGVVLVRRARRSPARRAAAETARVAAGRVLVRLDDTVGELELDTALSAGLHGAGAPTDLRRTRMSAQHARDAAFTAFAGLSDTALLPGEVRRRSERIAKNADATLAALEQARAAHAAWVHAHVPVAQQISAARARLGELRAAMGDPAGLVRELSARFDETEWRDAASAAREALDAADEAGRRLDAAASASDARPDLAAAERSLRHAQADERTLEETHRLVTQAATALPGEFDAARGAVRQGRAAVSRLDPTSAAPLSADIDQVDAELDDLEPDAARRPTATVARIARLRAALDTALGEAVTSQQRVRGARTALPGTVAAARSAIAHAETSVSHARTGADTRVRLAAASDALAEARTAHDPVAALDAARRALDAAGDAAALAALDRAAASTDT